jgi:hypothetical protein
MLGCAPIYPVVGHRSPLYDERGHPGAGNPLFTTPCRYCALAHTQKLSHTAVTCGAYVFEEVHSLTVHTTLTCVKGLCTR